MVICGQRRAIVPGTFTVSLLTWDYGSICFANERGKTNSHALAPFHRLFLRWGISGERDSTLRERRHGAPVSEPVRDSTRRRAIAGVGQRLVGLGELSSRLPAPGPGWEFRVPSLVSCPGRWRGRFGDGADAFARFRTILRRSVNEDQVAGNLHGAPALMAQVSGVVFRFPILYPFNPRDLERPSRVKLSM